MDWIGKIPCLLHRLADIGLVQIFAVYRNRMRLRINLNRIPRHGDNAFNQRLVERIRLRNHNDIAALRMKAECGDRHPIAIQQRWLH